MRPVSIPQIGPPNLHRLNAAKNRRAPAGALEQTPTVGSAAVLGRINLTTDPTSCFDHANPAPECSPVGCGQECPRSCQRVRTNTDARERGRPRPHQPDNRSYDLFRSCKSCARTFTGWGCDNNVPVPISHHSISPLIPVVSHALPRMHWALAGAKRLHAAGVGRREAFGVRRLAAALFLCPNNVPVPISHIPHQPDDRSCDPFRSRKSGHRTCTA